MLFKNILIQRKNNAKKAGLKLRGRSNLVCLTKNVEKFEKKFPQLLFQIFFCTSCMSKSTIDVSGFAAGTHISSIAISLYIFNLLSMYVNTGYSKWIVSILNSYCGSFWYWYIPVIFPLPIMH